MQLECKSELALVSGLSPGTLLQAKKDGGWQRSDEEPVVAAIKKSLVLWVNCSAATRKCCIALCAGIPRMQMKPTIWFRKRCCDARPRNCTQSIDYGPYQISHRASVQ